jgi:hypothetical protein
VRIIRPPEEVNVLREELSRERMLEIVATDHLWVARTAEVMCSTTAEMARSMGKTGGASSGGEESSKELRRERDFWESEDWNRESTESAAESAVSFMGAEEWRSLSVK